MSAQYDAKVRLVGLSNLKAMCRRLSGVSHRYGVTQITPTRVWVEYSNPDEYGSADPVAIALPAFEDKELQTILVLFYIIGTKNAGAVDDLWQAYIPLWDCPEIFRPWRDSEEWLTKAEWDARQGGPQ